jgi:hypothetical protein
MIGSLSVMVIFLSVVGFRLRQDVDDARARLTALEVKAVAENAASRTTEVGTCYSQARGRPRLITILRLLGSTAERDPVGRAAVNSMIMEYEESTPTVAECDKLAAEHGLDPEDFPAP